MYKGWIRSSLKFQETIGFIYQGKEQIRERMFKFTNCEVTEKQLNKMKLLWDKFKGSIEWELKEKINEIYGVKEGEVLASIIGYNHYFFNKFHDIYKVSRLKTWKEYNGLYVTNREKFVCDNIKCIKDHIDKNLVLCDNLGGIISKKEKQHSYNIKDIDNYIECLNKIKKQLIELNKK